MSGVPRPGGNRLPERFTTVTVGPLVADASHSARVTSSSRTAAWDTSSGAGPGQRWHPEEGGAVREERPHPNVCHVPTPTPRNHLLRPAGPSLRRAGPRVGDSGQVTGWETEHDAPASTRVRAYAYRSTMLRTASEMGESPPTTSSVSPAVRGSSSRASSTLATSPRLIASRSSFGGPSRTVPLG